MNYREMQDWLDRQLNLETMREMEEMIPMLPAEREALRRWTRKGHDPENNPWGYLDEDGWPMNYVEGYRRNKGYYFTIYYHILED